MTISKSTLQQVPYINLHLHTNYSILDGVGTIKDHVDECCNQGHAGVAITDHGVMSGCLQLYKISKQKGVACVLGSELYITKDLNERDPNNKYNHITVLVKNETGYRNLCYLTSIASTEDHFYVRPRISLEELFAHKEGLIITSGCFIGMIPQAIHRETGEEEKLLKMFKDEFADDFYIELHLSDIRMNWDKTLKKHVDQGFNPQEKVNIRLIELAEKYGIKSIIAQDSHMPKKEHHFIQSIMIWNSPSGKDGWHFSDAYYTMSVAEMYEKSKNTCPYITDDQFIQFCENSVDILNKCKDLNLKFEPLLPSIRYEENPVNKSEKLEQTLCHLEDLFMKVDIEFASILKLSRSDMALRTALKVVIRNKKIDLTNDTYRQRLTSEIMTIQRNGVIKLIDYFLLLEDVTRFVREGGHFRGFGRGSGAGSLLAFCLDITDVDPIKFNLLFERFLTKERIGRMDFSMPEFGKKIAP